MCKVFLDTNIVLDYVLSRDIYGASAEQIFDAITHKEAECYIAAHTVSNVFYIMRKDIDTNIRKLVLKNITAICNIVPIDTNLIEKAASDDRFDDFEDALEMACAEECNADLFITRDIDGFKDSKIKVAQHI